MLSPALLAQLSQRGIIPQQPQSAPTSTVPPDILAYAAGLQQSAQPAPPAQAPPPQAAVPPKPLGSYSAADIAAANGPAPSAPTVSPEAFGLSTHRKPYRLIENSAGQEADAAPSAAAPSAMPPEPPAQQQAAQAPIAAQGTPYQMVPGREIRAVSPTVERMFNTAADEKRSAANASEAAEVGANETQASELDKLAARLAAQSDEMQRKEALRGKAYDDQLADYRRYADEAAHGEVKTPHTSFVSALGVALGAIGAGLTHTPNTALEVVNKQIDENIAAQRANIENKRASAHQSLEGLGEMRARFGDERQADAAERARQIEAAKTQGDALVARAQSPILAAKWQTVRAGLDEEQAKLHMQMFPWQQAHMVGGPGKPLDNVFMAPDGQRYQARDADSRKRLAQGAAANTTVQNLITDYQHALQQLGAGDRIAAKGGYTTEAMARANTAYNALNARIRQNADEGVWKKSEVELIESTLASPESFSGKPEAQLGMVRKQSNDLWANTMRAEDALPVQQGFAVNPQGQLAPRNAYTGGTVAPPAPGASTIGRPVR